MKKTYRNICCLVFLLAFVLAGASFTASAADGELGKVFRVYPVNEPYGIRITWKSVDEAEGYKLYRRCGDNGEQEYVTRLNGIDNTEYYDNTVVSGRRYFYSVRAISGSLEGVMSDEKRRTFIASPRITKAESKNGYMQISWEPIAGADEYTVYRKTGDAQWQKIGTSPKTGNVFNDKKVISGIAYRYAVVTRDGNGLSTMDNIGFKAQYMSAPTSFTLTNTSNKVYFSWGKVSGAVKYNVYRKESTSKTWSRVATVPNCSYIDSNIKNGVQYYYTARAIGKANGISTYKTSRKIMALTMPTGVVLTSKPTAVRISWSKQPAATSYRIYKSANGKWERIAVISNKNTTFFDDISVKDGVTYKYTVAPYYGAEMGSYNKTGVFGKHYSAPKLNLQYSPYGIKLVWSKAKAGTSYSIFYKGEDQTKWTALAKINSISTVSYTHPNAAYGRKNTYFIRVNGANLRTDSYNKTIYGLDPNKKTVAFTYDDGPSSDVTNRVLSTLAKYNSRATFFVVGNRVGSYKSQVKKAVSMGCEIGNHSYSHATLTKLNASSIQSQINKTNSVIKSVAGVTPTLVRTPGGAVNSTVRRAVNYPIISWSVDTLDWKSRNANSVVNEIKGNVKDGSIVLMHDLYGSTATATEQIVPWLIANDYQIVTVTELMQLKGVDMKTGTVYYSATSYK